MSVPYYLGCKAIAERLGYKATRAVMRLHLEEGLPMFKRRMQHPCGRGYVQCWATSEAAITAWEIAQGKRSSERMKAKQELKRLTGKIPPKPTRES